MSRPKLLDLFCGAGGCSVGYHRAGFDVVGVDREPHPDYPFPMVVADAMEILAVPTFLAGFDVAHASPPCPAYSTITPAESRENHPELIGPVRDALRQWGGAYVIENVEGAARRMDNPVRVCGSAFGLKVRRHRYFETNVFMVPTECYHQRQGVPVGVYGKHADPVDYVRPTSGTSRGIRAHSLSEAQEALGIDWMTDWDDLTDAIPPAYTKYLGAQLLDHLEAAA